MLYVKTTMNEDEGASVSTRSDCLDELIEIEAVENIPFGDEPRSWFLMLAPMCANKAISDSFEHDEGDFPSLASAIVMAKHNVKKYASKEFPEERAKREREQLVLDYILTETGPYQKCAETLAVEWQELANSGELGINLELPYDVARHDVSRAIHSTL